MVLLLKLPTCYNGKMTFGVRHMANCIRFVYVHETDLLPVTQNPGQRACKNFLKFFPQRLSNYLLWCVFGLQIARLLVKLRRYSELRNDIVSSQSTVRKMIAKSGVHEILPCGRLEIVQCEMELCDEGNISVAWKHGDQRTRK